MKWWTWWPEKAGGGGEWYARIFLKAWQVKIREAVEQRIVLGRVVREIRRLPVFTVAVPAEDKRIARVFVPIIGRTNASWFVGR